MEIQGGEEKEFLVHNPSHNQQARGYHVRGKYHWLISNIASPPFISFYVDLSDVCRTKQHQAVT
jgi:hypothetical protein